MKKHINILLVVVAIAALVVTVVELKRWLASARADRDALAAVLEKNAAMKAQIDALKPKAEIRQLAVSVIAAEAAKNATQSTPAERGRARAIALDERKANDREFGLKYYAAMRSDIDMQYGPFYRLQHLTNEQKEALAGALFQKQLRYDKLNSEWLITKSEEDAKAGKEVADAEFAAAAQVAIGGDAYEQFQHYERQRPAWDYVSSYGGDLSLADMPLSLEQASQLADAIADSCVAFQKGKDLNMRTVHWDVVNDAAAKFLTPEQLDFFKNVEVLERNALLSAESWQSRAFSKAMQKVAQ